MPDGAFFPFCVAFGAVALLLPLIRALAVRMDFVDRPGGRKKHDDPVPPVGGLVVFPVFMALAACLPGAGDGPLWPFFTALALLLIVGALDDAHGVPVRVRFAVQFAAALLIVLPGQARVVMMGDLFGFGPLGLNLFSIPFSVIAVVLLINAVNLLDGLDGLGGGLGFVALFWLAVAAGGTAAVGSVWGLMGALGGFLLYNMRRPFRARASVFLGDAGSLALGLALAWFAIHLAAGGPDALVRPVSVAWILALPIYDTCGQFARRVSQGRHPFDPDHDHFHHHFLYAGFTPGRATAMILGLCFACGLVGVGGIRLGLPEAALTWPWMVLLLAHIYMSMRPHRFRRLVARLRRGGVVRKEEA